MSGDTDGNGQHSVNSDGYHVNLGYFDANGLNVHYYWDNKRNSNLGVSSARQSFLYLAEIPHNTETW